MNRRECFLLTAKKHCWLTLYNDGLTFWWIWCFITNGKLCWLMWSSSYVVITLLILLSNTFRHQSERNRRLAGKNITSPNRHKKVRPTKQPGIIWHMKGQFFLSTVAQKIKNKKTKINKNKTAVADQRS